MASWVDDREKRRQIADYFSSINSMTLRIMEERQKVVKKYKGDWCQLSVNEQDEKIDEWFSPTHLKEKYLEAAKDPESDVVSEDVFPALKLDTGQKVIETHTENEEEVTTYFDEHSDPFSCETRSQMDLTLPSNEADAVAKPTKKKTPPSTRDKTKKKKSVQKAEGYKTETLAVMTSYDKGFEENENIQPATSNEDEQPLDWQMPETDFSLDPQFGITSFNIDDLTITRCDLDTGFENYGRDSERDFQKSVQMHVNDVEDKKSLEKPPTKTKIGGLGSNELNESSQEKIARPNYNMPERENVILNDNWGKENVQIKKQSKTKRSKKNQGAEKVLAVSKSSPKSTIIDRTESDKIPTLVPVTSKKAPRKSSSSDKSRSSSRVNPRSSLTLDGAIHNLEVAMRQNSQQQLISSKSGSSSKNDSDDFTFDGLRKLSSDVDLENVFADAPEREGSPLLDHSAVTLDTTNKGDIQKTGFDFLDNW